MSNEVKKMTKKSTLLKIAGGWLILTLTFGSLLVNFQPARAATETATWPFATAGDYTVSDPSKIEVAGDVARLVPIDGGAQEKNYPFTAPADYTYDPAKAEITGGVAQLKGIPPYAHWHLNEPSGSAVWDSSGNGRNCMTVNMTGSNRVAAKLNNGLNFVSASSQYVNCGDIASFERTDKFSVELWFKTTAASQRALIGRMQSSSPYKGWEVGLANGHLYFYLISDYSSNNYIEALTTSIGWNNDVPHHLVVTYDGSSTASGVKIYIDENNQALTIVKNTLAASIVTSANCTIGTRNGIIYYNGLLDEVVIYNKVLSVSEVSYRYNSGNGREDLGYSTNNPIIQFNDELIDANGVESWDGFTETATKPAESEVKYILSDNGGTSWKYWNGSAWATSSGDYAQSNAVDEVNTNIGSFPTAQNKLKIKAFLHADNGLNGLATPTLDNVKVDYTRRFAFSDNPTVQNNAGQAYNILDTFTETLSGNNQGTVKYQISNNGSDWYYYNGSIWASASGYSQTNTASEINTHATTFKDDVGIGNFYFKAFLHSNGFQAVELEQIALESRLDYINVTSPNIGETMTVGSSHNITWEYTDSVGSTVDIYYSTDGGASYPENHKITDIPISIGEDGNGSYLWSPIPDDISNQVRIKIISNTGETDESNGNNNIFGALVITSPSEDDIWGALSNHYITWITIGTPHNVNLYYSTDGGVTYPYIIAIAAPNSGTYLWRVPDLASATTARIKVQDATYTAVFGTSSNFTGVSGGPTEATYITQTFNPALFNSQALSTLTAGLLKNADTGVLSIAAPGTDYQAPGNYITDLTNDVITAAGPGSVAATIANKAVTLVKMADIAAASFLGRITAATGNPEVLSVATAKTMLDLAGTNTGDQTNISGNAATATALQTARYIFGISFDGTADIGSALGTGAYATIADYAPLASPTFTGTVTIPSPFMLGATSVTATGAELNYVGGVTSAIQTQLNAKAPTDSPIFTGSVTMPGTGIWNSDGNVGIGTTVPGGKLEVSGTTKTTDLIISNKISCSGKLYTDALGNVLCGTDANGGGTVTSVGLSMPAQFTVTSSPVTASGTLTAAWNSQTANYVLAGPVSDGAAVPTFRAIVAADIPTLNQNTTGNAATATNVAYSGLTGTVPTWNQNTTGNAATATNLTGLTATIANLNTVTGALGTAAFTASSAYATAAQGTLATNALPSASFTDAAVTGKFITGYTGIAGIISVSDSILTAINKLNGNIAANGNGTVTSVSTAAANNGVTATWSMASPTPALTIGLGTITPTSVAASGTVTGSNLSGTNTGDNATNSQYSGLVTNATHTGDATGSTALTVVKINGTQLSLLGTGILKNTTTTGVPSIAIAADFPTLNQNTTGNAATATNVAYTGLTGTVPTWNQSTTGNAATATNLTGLTATIAELNVLDGILPTVTELNYVDGVTSNIQTQLGLKAPLASPTFTGTVGGITAAMVGAPSGSGTSTGSNTGDQTLSGLGGVAANTAITGATKTKITYDAKGLVTAGADATTADIADSTNKKYVSDAQLVVIGNTSGTNTGDNATNSQYSGLATSKQDVLVSGTNIKTINSTTLLGSGNLAVQPTLVSGTNIKTINGASILTSGDLTLLTSLSGAVLVDQSTPQTIGATGSRLAKLWATDITVTNAIAGSITGNAATATALQNARSIFGISFDGTVNIGSALGTGAYATIANYAPLASPTFTGTVSGITAAMVGAPSGSGTSTGSNTGDNAANTTYASDYRAANFVAGTNYENPLTFSTPLSRSTNTISMPAATTSVSGYLTSTDWNTFNNKQPAGSYLTGTKVDSFNTRTGAVTLTSGDVTTALAYTPYNATNPSGYITSSGTATNFSGSLSGDVTGTQGATALSKISGTTLTISSLASGQILKYNGTAWVNAADNNSGGTVTSVGGTGTVSGLTLSGTVTSTGNLTLGGTLSLTSANVTTALGFTPYNATNPSGYTSNTGTVTSVGGTGTVSGLTLTGTVTTTGSLTLGGTLSLTSGNVTTALGFTPYNATNPSGYITGNQTITLSGDATGSGTTAITVAVADDSHNHIYSNIDATTSANWASEVTDETGTGAMVFAASPTFTGSVTMPGTGIWNSSGNVGIGMTVPVYALQVHTTDTTNIDPLAVRNKGQTAANGLIMGGIGFETTALSGGVRAAIRPVQRNVDSDIVGLSFFVHPSGTGSDPLEEKFRIDYNGNVGIGVTGPITPLEVAGAISSYDASVPEIRLNRANTTTSWRMINDGSDLKFQTNASKFVSGTVYDQMVILSGGNVGIGVTDPFAKLDVNGIGLAAQSLGIRSYAPSAGGAAVAAFAGMSTTPSAGQQIGLLATGNPAIAAAATTGGYAAIFSGGNVGIGITNPGSLLAIKDTTTTGTATPFSISGSMNDAAGIVQMRIDAGLQGEAKIGLQSRSYKQSSIDFADGGYGIRIGIPGGANSFVIKDLSNNIRMTVQGAGNVIIANLAGAGNRAVYSDASGTLTNSSSDISLKKNIADIPSELDPLATLKRLRGVFFNWDNSKPQAANLGTQREMGMIAQEVEKVLPQVVGINSDGTKSIDYPKLSAFLIEVAKVQQSEIEKQQKAIDDLKAGGKTADIKLTGSTIFDESTNKPYCLKIVDGEIKLEAGECNKLK